MKVLIIGSNGLLGSNLSKVIKKGFTSIGEIPISFKNAELLCADKKECDITNIDSIRSVFLSFKPNVVFNCAGYVDFNGCENNPNLAYDLNSDGPKNLALVSQEVGAKLVHMSTDYVFDGSKNSPYNEKDIPLPLSVYGKSKLLGAQNVIQNCDKHFIVRTAWLYGGGGVDFVGKLLKNIDNNGFAKVVDDQYGTPTFIEDLCYELLYISETNNYGIYHCTNNGVATWHDFALEIAKLLNVKADIIPCKTNEFDKKHLRPCYSVLENRFLKDTIGDKMREWRIALRDYIENFYSR